MIVTAWAKTTECAEIDGVEYFEECAPELLLKSFINIIKGRRKVDRGESISE